MDFNDVTTDVTHAANVIMRHQVAMGSSETKTLSFRWGRFLKALKSCQSHWKFDPLQRLHAIRPSLRDHLLMWLVVVLKREEGGEAASLWGNWHLLCLNSLHRVACVSNYTTRWQFISLIAFSLCSRSQPQLRVWSSRTRSGLLWREPRLKPL